MRPIGYYDAAGNEIHFGAGKDPRMRYCARRETEIDWSPDALLPQIAAGKLLVVVRDKNRCYCWLEFRQGRSVLFVTVHNLYDPGGVHGLYEASYRNTTLTPEILFGSESLALACMKIERKAAAVEVGRILDVLQKELRTD